MINKREYAYLTGLLLALAAIDLIHVVALGIILTIVLSPAAGTGGADSASAILEYFNNNPINIYIIFTLTCFIKIMVGTFLSCLQFKFLSDAKERIVKEVSQFVMSSLKTKSDPQKSMLIRVIGTDAHEYIIGYVNSICYIATEIFVFCALSFVLLLASPNAFVFVACVALLSGILYFIANRIINDGDYPEIERQKISIFSDIVEARKELRLSYFGDSLYKKLEAASNKSKNLLMKRLLLASAPKYIIETNAVLLFVSGLFYLSRHQIDSNDTIIVVSSIGAMAYRILPSISRLISSAQQIKLNFHYANSIAKFKDFRRNFTIFDDEFNYLKITNLKVRINDDKFLTVKDLEIKFGDCVGIKGVSGSGKTSLVESLMNLRSYESGFIKVNGEVIDPEFITKGLFYYLAQESTVIADTILFNVCGTNNLDDVDISRLKDALRHTGLDILLKNKNIDFDYFVDESGGNLSGGQRQRLVLARAIYSNSPIIVLDESTSALDKKSERDMSKYISYSKGTKTFIVISHSDSFLENCDKIYCIKDNQLIQI